MISDLTDLIKEELNVKEVIFIEDTSEYMNFMVKPNFKVAGPIFGADIKYFTEALAKMDIDSINKLRNNETIELDINGSDYTISSDMVDIRISSKEGFNVGFENNNFIILNTELNDDLILEGIAREIVSKVQQLRKTKDFNIVDRIDIYYEADPKVDETFAKFEEYIKNETLAENIIKKNLEAEATDVNGYSFKFDVVKK
ncbi:MAG: hypothetical protein J6X03_00820 [Bacilli bacterium]|nr:hypothetical protein [Bacilli bacterium]